MKRELEFKRASVIVSALASMLFLAACGGDKQVKQGQTLAKVNDREITVHQLNAELKTMDARQLSDQKESLQQRALDVLIDRQLLVDAAMRDKLDRDYEVLQSLERAKAQVLAQAYLQKRAASMSRPNAKEVSAYFEQHPELFAARKTYDMRFVAIASSDFSDELKQAVDTARSVDDVVAWLDARKIRNQKGQAYRTSADLPMKMVAKLPELGKGAPFILREQASIMIATLTYVKDSPVNEDAARAQIEQYLMAEKLGTFAADEVRRLRQDAKISLLNEVQAKAAPAGEARPGTSEQSKKTANDSLDAANIDRGIAGLK